MVQQETFPSASESFKVIVNLHPSTIESLLCGSSTASDHPLVPAGHLYKSGVPVPGLLRISPHHQTGVSTVQEPKQRL